MFIVRKDTGSSRVRNCVQERGSQGTRLHSDKDIIDGQRGHTGAIPSDERLHSRLHVAVVSGSREGPSQILRKDAASYTGICV